LALVARAREVAVGIPEDWLTPSVPSEAVDRMAHPLCPGCDTRHPGESLCITADDARWLSRQGWVLLANGRFRDSCRGRVEYPLDALRIERSDQTEADFYMASVRLDRETDDR
jgi:hypothetical protein